MRTIVVGCAVGALLALGPGGAASGAPAPTPGGAAAGELGIRLLEAPVDRRDDPRARAYIVDHVAPGARFTRRVEISHRVPGRAGRPVAVTLYAAPAAVTGGNFLFDAPGADPDLARWISVDRRAVTLPPDGTAEVTVTVAVPRTATAGERYAVVWAQTESAGAGQVRQVVRTGIRVYLDVGPGGEPPTDFAIERVTAVRDPAGVPRVSAQLRNTGRRAIDVTGTVTLAGGPGGVRAGPYRVEGGTTLAAGQRGTVVAALAPELADGPWRATVTLQSGTVRRSGTYRLSFPAPAAAPVAATADAGPRPGLLAAAAGVLGLLLLAAWRRRRPPRRA